MNLVLAFTVLFAGLTRDAVDAQEICYTLSTFYYYCSGTCSESSSSKCDNGEKAETKWIQNARGATGEICSTYSTYYYYCAEGCAENSKSRCSDGKKAQCKWIRDDTDRPSITDEICATYSRHYYYCPDGCSENSKFYCSDGKAAQRKWIQNAKATGEICTITLNVFYRYCPDGCAENSKVDICDGIKAQTNWIRDDTDKKPSEDDSLNALGTAGEICATYSTYYSYCPDGCAENSTILCNDGNEAEFRWIGIGNDSDGFNLLTIVIPVLGAVIIISVCGCTYACSEREEPCLSNICKCSDNNFCNNITVNICPKLRINQVHPNEFYQKTNESNEAGKF